jgi:hypothetical protein
LVLGYVATPNLKAIAEDLWARAWKKLKRPARYDMHTRPRRRPENVKVAREFENIRLRSGEVADVNYRPTACRRTCRMVMPRKNLSVEQAERRLFDEIRYLFYVITDCVREPAEFVFEVNDRCHHENLSAQLHRGVLTLRPWTAWRATGHTW